MNFPQEYLEVLKLCKEKGVPLGDREFLLKETTGEKTPVGKLNNKPLAKKEGVTIE
jgi:hypothetical protein